jgi:hypothetical protein
VRAAWLPKSVQGSGTLPPNKIALSCHNVPAESRHVVTRCATGTSNSPDATFSALSDRKKIPMRRGHAKRLAQGALAAICFAQLASGPVLAQTAQVESPSAAAKAPWAATTRRILVEPKRFTSRNAVLSGTLYLPADREMLGAVVVTHGAALPLRDSALYKHLIEMLPSRGIAVLVYDREGNGQSTGNRHADFDSLANDAIAGGEMLARDPRIDRNRIGIWGLSQGGWLSMLAASRSTIFKFAIAVSAPLVTPDVQMLYSSTNTLEVFGYPKADIDEMRHLRLAVDNYMRRGGDRKSIQSELEADSQKPWFKYLWMDSTLADRESSQWRKQIELDPLASLRSIRVPLLVVFGSIDPVAPVQASVDVLKQVEPRHPNLTVAVVTGADHFMQTDVPAKELLDPQSALAGKGAPDSAEYFGLLAAWLEKQGLVQNLGDRLERPAGSSLCVIQKGAARHRSRSKV